MLASTAIALPWPSNGPRPSTAAYRVAPRDHRSEAGLAGSPLMRSGKNQLQPGDLVFFYADIGHVGLYIGNGLMVDAPDFGEDVQVQPVMWNVYVGAVRIVG